MIALLGRTPLSSKGSLQQLSILASPFMQSLQKATHGSVMKGSASGNKKEEVMIVSLIHVLLRKQTRPSLQSLLSIHHSSSSHNIRQSLEQLAKENGVSLFLSPPAAV